MTVAVTYFEDVAVGDVAVTPAMTLTEAHAALYRGLVGESPQDAGTVPEVLPLCLVTGLGWRMPRTPLAVLAFMSLEWTIHRPLRVGETIHCRMRVMSKRSMREGGVVIQDQEIVDPDGSVAHSGRFIFLVAKRAATPVNTGGAR